MKLAITGGAGTLGSALVKKVIETSGSIKEILVLSRDEKKHEELFHKMGKSSKIEFVVCDVRDKIALVKALKGVSILIHTAALKRVGNGECFTEEYIKTNIEGTRNVLHACEVNEIKQGLLVSTDKAVDPINLYGATKFIAEKLWKAFQKKNSERRFAIVRYGNVLGSNGSVIQKWKKEKMPQVCEKSTRFFIRIEDAVDFCFFALCHAKGGEVFIKPSVRLAMNSLFKSLYNRRKSVKYNPKDFEKTDEILVSHNERAEIFKFFDSYVIVDNCFDDTLNYWHTKENAKIFDEMRFMTFSSSAYQKTKESEIDALLSGI